MARMKFSDHLSRWREQGWQIERTNGGHLRCTHQHATNVVFVSSNPKEWRSLENSEALLRKALRGSSSAPKPAPAEAIAPAVTPKPTPTPQKPVRTPVAATAPAPARKPSAPSRPRLAPEIVGAVQFLIMRTRCDGRSWKAVRMAITRFRNEPQFREGCIKAYRYAPAYQLRVLRGRFRGGEGIARETGQPIPPPKPGKLTLGKPLARPLTPVIPGLRTVEVSRPPPRHPAHYNRAPQQDARPSRPQRETAMGLALKTALHQRDSSPPPPKDETPQPVTVQEAPKPVPVTVPEPVVVQAPPIPVEQTEPVVIAQAPEISKTVRKPVAPLPLIAMQAAKGLMESALAVAPPKKRRSPPRPVVVGYVKPEGRNAERDADIMDRFENKKFSALQIAKHHGVSVAVVSKVIKNARKPVAASKSSNVVVLRVPDTAHGMTGASRMIATGGGKR